MDGLKQHLAEKVQDAIVGMVNNGEVDGLDVEVLSRITGPLITQIRVRTPAGPRFFFVKFSESLT